MSSGDPVECVWRSWTKAARNSLADRRYAQTEPAAAWIWFCPHSTANRSQRCFQRHQIRAAGQRGLAEIRAGALNAGCESGDLVLPIARIPWCGCSMGCRVWSAL